MFIFLILFLLAVLGLHCHSGFSLVMTSGAYTVRGLLTVASFVADCRLCRLWVQGLRRVGSAVAVPRFWSTGSIVLMHGLSSKACGIISD